MKLIERIVLAVMILVIDLAVFFVPLSALLLVFVVIFKPQWFKKVVDKVYEDSADVEFAKKLAKRREAVETKAKSKFQAALEEAQKRKAKKHE